MKEKLDSVRKIPVALVAIALLLLPITAGAADLCPYDTTGDYTYDAARTPSYLFFGDGEITFDPDATWYLDDVYGCYNSYFTPGYAAYFPKCDVDNSGAIDMAEIYEIYYRSHPVNQTNTIAQSACIEANELGPFFHCGQSDYDRGHRDINNIVAHYPVTDLILNPGLTGKGHESADYSYDQIKCYGDLLTAQFDGLNECYHGTTACISGLSGSNCAEVEITLASPTNTQLVVDEYNAVAAAYGGYCERPWGGRSLAGYTAGFHYFEEANAGWWSWDVRATDQCQDSSCDCDVTYRFRTHADNPFEVWQESVLSDLTTGACTNPLFGGGVCPDDDGDGVCNADDLCPGADDNLDTDGDGTADCLESCPNDANKTVPGVCGCSVADTDSDGDGVPDCNDLCENDPNKTAPGMCGCGTPDEDADSDGICDDVDPCPADPDNDADGDGICGDVDNCPNDYNPSQINICQTNPDTLMVQHTSTTLDIDGDLSEFAAAPSVTVQTGAGAASFRLMWDDTFLFVAAQVADADLWTPGTGRDSGDLWMSDGIELMLDTALTATPAADDDDRQVMVTAAGDLLDGESCGASVNVAATLDVVYAVVVDGTIDDGVADTGYTLEMSIPWAKLATVPVAGHQLGADLALNNAGPSPDDLLNNDWAEVLPYAQPIYWNLLELAPSADCGDLVCDGGESCTSCPADCGPCAAVCSDGTCDPGETCADCPVDCGPCAAVCSDGTCDPGETCTSCPADCGACPTGGGNLSAVWANNGQDKVVRGDLRATGSPGSVTNSVWDGTSVSVFGAKNEVVAFNLVLEAATTVATDVTVSLDSLSSASGVTLTSAPRTGEGVFDWTDREIELFYVRYLPIQGISMFSYASAYYDERHAPERMRRPWSGEGNAGPGTVWSDRPDADKFYPDIAVPIELENSFDIAGGNNQSIWADIYIPKTAPAGTYTGNVVIREGGTITRTVPVQLTVRNFELPDDPSGKTMLYLGYADVNERYLGERYPWESHPEADRVAPIRDRHFKVAHRHKVSLIDTNSGVGSAPTDAPRSDWAPRLDGSLFTAANGYDGPGVGTPNNVFSIGTYGGWNWFDGSDSDAVKQSKMQSHAAGWVDWFDSNAPGNEYFLYLEDEPGSGRYPELEQWAGWLDGTGLMSFCTVGLPSAVANIPSLSYPSSWPSITATQPYVDAQAAHLAKGRPFSAYNGRRPVTGSFATEDDGIALRVLAWSQYKMNISRWFFWESTYYYNFQCGNTQTDVFADARTFGCYTSDDSVNGRTGWGYTNGDGLLFYPGTDTIYPNSSYGLDGPIASLRLKLWRRGIQDFDYLALAAAVDPTRVNQLVQELVPEVLWEVGVDDPNDPTWKKTDISWSSDPEIWEAARAELADIIEGI